jgi:CO dehydrogenase/acetyl-CoA synthase delta subunit
MGSAALVATSGLSHSVDRTAQLGRPQRLRRNERGERPNEPDVYRGGDSFELPRLTRAIAVDEVYDDILDDAGGSFLR